MSDLTKLIVPYKGNEYMSVLKFRRLIDDFVNSIMLNHSKVSDYTGHVIPKEDYLPDSEDELNMTVVKF